VANDAGVPLVTVEVGCALPVRGGDVAKNGFCLIYYPGILRLQALAVKELSQRLGVTPKVVVVSYDAPSSRFEGDTVMKTLAGLGIEAVEHVVVPVRDYDLNAIAGRIVSRGPNWVIGSGTNEHTGGPLLEALRRQGWQGYFLGPPLAIVQQEMVRLKDDRFFTAVPLAGAADDVSPIRDLMQAHQQFGAPFPPERLTWGWFAGMVVSEALSRCGWPCDGKALATVLAGLKVDTLGLTGAPLTFSSADHAGSPTMFKVYGWDRATQRLVTALDWRVSE
jgi:ABC-type branched-subunit amino acid transport system substrate-binding protein